MRADVFAGIAWTLLVYDAAADSGDAASRDVFDQLDAVEAALREFGVGTRRLAVGLDLGAFRKSLTTAKPGLVFNLAESLDGSDRLQTIVPMLLEDWRVPFTGCGSAAMLLSNHKIDAKIRLLEGGLPTPAFARLDAGGALRVFPEAAAVSGDWIVKALETHASKHLDDESVLRAPDRETLAERIRAASRRHGEVFFAERFVDGREFNLTVFEGDGGEPEVMPPAEIRFDDLAPERPRIVGYAAKWDEGSDEYHDTVRSFSFEPGDAGLLRRLRELAAAAWRRMGLAGYARVDFRVGADGLPSILEVNTNPCLSPDAGFAAAAREGGVPYAQLVSRIAEAGLRRWSRS